MSTDRDAHGVLVGGVGTLYQGDLDLGRHVVERLSAEPLPAHVCVEDLYHGAVDVVRLLEDLRPATLILVGAEARGRGSGTVERRGLTSASLSVDEARSAVGEALTGYVSIDLLVEVASAFGALPGRAVAIEVEPATVDLSEQLSPEGAAALDVALGLVRREVERSGLFPLAAQLRGLIAGNRLEPCPALDTLRLLLDAVALLDAGDAPATAGWERTFALRDRLRSDIAEGATGAGMDHLDWSLWWTLIEELDRLQARDVSRETSVD